MSLSGTYTCGKALKPQLHLLSLFFFFFFTVNSLFLQRGNTPSLGIKKEENKEMLESVIVGGMTNYWLAGIMNSFLI